MAAILSSVFYTIFCWGQTSIPEQLHQIIVTNDINRGLKLYNSINPDSLNVFTDSVLFEYHYLGAAINNLFAEDLGINTNPKKALFHLQEAQKLCENSLGTWFDGYMQIMTALGDYKLEQNNYKEALLTYEEGLIKSLSVRESYPQSFANLIMGVQECYERLGWFNEVSVHLMDAWSFWPKDMNIEMGTYIFYPLWSLQYYYFKYEFYERSLLINDMIIEFLSEKGITRDNLMAEQLYMRGNIQFKMGLEVEAVQTHRKALSILNEKNLKTELLYGQIAGNLLTESINAGTDEDIIVLLQTIKEYGNKTNNSDIYKDALFSAANEYYKKNDYVSALTFNSQLIELNHSEDVLVFLIDQKERIEYAKKIVESLRELENNYKNLVRGSNDWFDVAFDLSNAYSLLNQNKSNIQVLNAMYEEFKYNEEAKQEYYNTVLTSLFYTYLENGDNKKAFIYALEKWNFISEYPDLPIKYRYETLNNLIVAKLRDNKISDIESYLTMADILCREACGMDSEEYAIYIHNLGRAYQLQGKFPQAKKAYLESIDLQIKNKGQAMNKTIQYFLENEEMFFDEELYQ